MWSINFSNLISSKPELRRSATILKRWLDTHQGSRVISAPDVVQFASHDSGVLLGDAIMVVTLLVELSKQGDLVQKFALESPDGQLIYPYFDSRTDIPKTFEDDEHHFSVKESLIRPVFVGAHNG